MKVKYYLQGEFNSRNLNSDLIGYFNIFTTEEDELIGGVCLTITEEGIIVDITDSEGDVKNTLGYTFEELNPYED